MLAHAGPEWTVPTPLGRPPNIESHVARLEVCGSKHWPIPSETQLRCRVCKARGVTQKVFVKCCECKAQRRISNNITCDLLKKTWGLKPIGK